MSTPFLRRGTPPGPRPLPILGALGNLIPFARNPIEYMSRLYERYGEVVTLAKGTTDYVFVFSPLHNRLALGNPSLFEYLDIRHSPLRVPKNSSLARLFSGLIQMSGDSHKDHRRQLSPPFKRGLVERYLDGISSVVDEKLSDWRVGQKRDLYKEMKDLSLSIAVKTIVGLDPQAGGLKLSRLLEQWMGLVFSLRTVLLPLKLWGLRYYRLLALSDELESRILRLIEQKKEGDTGDQDVLSLLIKARSGQSGSLTDEELIGHINFLFFAGHTTTASALTWTIFLLDQHPQVMRELMDELQSRVGDDGPSAGCLDDLPLMDAVIKESMRLLPPVMWSSRKSNSGFSIGNYDFPSGTTLIHSPYITHRIASCFEQPYKFLPARWLSARPGPYEYIPFSAGSTTCLGATLAMMEMKLVLAMLLGRFRLVVPSGTRIDLGGIMLSSPRQVLPVQVAVPDRRSYRNEVAGNIRRAVDLNLSKSRRLPSFDREAITSH